MSKKCEVCKRTNPTWCPYSFCPLGKSKPQQYAAASESDDDDSFASGAIIGNIIASCFDSGDSDSTDSSGSPFDGFGGGDSGGGGSSSDWSDD